MAAKPKFTAADLLAKAEALLEQLQPDAAVKFLEKARTMAPQDTTILDTLGETVRSLSACPPALSFTTEVVDGQSPRPVWKAAT